ncbi:DUF1192 domain-containing protein [Niveispirillum irakense]|uniref:DUF1192 domain-containing protein n=1 Tax=Niveispirillum irakense TaxID=34011 RepID=UPI000422A874|nr:DUF1192 domain-containing protein [Niveispirillum irakense]
MAFDLDELLPSKPVKKPVDLDSLSVGDLQDYIVTLEAEIARARAMIQEKQDVHAAAQAFFKR